MSDLQRAFDAKIKAAVAECRQLGYQPNDFEGMLSSASAVQVAEKLVLSGDIHSGLKRLAQMGRLDLSVESIMSEPRFAPLFKLELIQAAQWRLSQVK